MKVAVARIAMLLAALGPPVRAEVQTMLSSPVRARMPEPLLTESITDLDGALAGEVEIDVSASVLRGTTGPGQWQSSVEVEWRGVGGFWPCLGPRGRRGARAPEEHGP